MLAWGCLGLTLAVLAPPALGAGPLKLPVAPRCASVSTATCAAAARLGRGINMGNALEAPVEGQYGVVIQSGYAQRIRDAGFDHVRLPVRWSNHAAPDGQARLDPVFSARVKEVVDAFLGAGLRVVLDAHHYRQLDGDQLEDKEYRVSDAVVEERLTHIWRQVAERYKSYPDSLYFELYNEPHGALTDARWNALYPKVLSAIREVSPERVVIVGPGGWNSPKNLEAFAAPKDAATIVTVHQYEPHSFTHQGAWGSQTKAGSVTCCSGSDRESIAAMLDTADRWSVRHGFPIYVGEFGSHVTAEAGSRRAFLRAMRSELQSRRFSWAVFNFGSDFGLFDTDAGRWDEPLLRELMQ